MHIYISYILGIILFSSRIYSDLTVRLRELYKFFIAQIFKVAPDNSADTAMRNKKSILPLQLLYQWEYPGSHIKIGFSAWVSGKILSLCSLIFRGESVDAFKRSEVLLDQPFIDTIPDACFS